ncbi:MAG: hypothetical protein KKA73_10095, partial [Chloroflexi bacterium]|nr:hypothetical protein [Chloroflexota bacterium]
PAGGGGEPAGGGGEPAGGGGGGPAFSGGICAGWAEVNVMPGSKDALAALYFPLANLRRAEILAQFPIIKGTVEGAVETVEGVPFFRFTLKAEDKTYQVQGIPEASHAPNLFASPVMYADREPQAGDSVTVMGELKGDTITANYVAIEGQGVWFYRSYLLYRNVQTEMRPEIAELYDGLPVAVLGIINSGRAKGDFYEFNAALTIPSDFVSRGALFIGTFRKGDGDPYVEISGIFCPQGGQYVPVLVEE